MIKEQEEENLVNQKVNLENIFINVFLRPPSDKQTIYQLTLTAESINFKPQKEKQEINLELKDVIGIKLQHIVDVVHKITINSFPFRKRLFRKPARTLESVEIWTSQNKKELQRWQIEALRRVTCRQIQNESQLKFIAYFNPVAGSNSKAQMKRVQEFASQSNFSLQVIETKGKNFCKQHISGIDYSKYQAVLIVSGDGLMHEFVNSQCCGKIPVTHVPAGSGNAFAKTQTTQAKEQCSSEIAVFLAIKGRIKPFNVFKVQLQKLPQPIYSFLSVEWAFLADIDMGSQFLRFCGGLRFEIYSAWRLLVMRRYPAKIYYSFEDKKLPALTQPITDKAFHIIEGEFLNALFSSIPFISDKYQFSPLLKIEDKAIDMQFLTSHHGRWNLLKYLLNSQTGAHFDRQKGELKEGAQLGWGTIKSYRIQPTGEGDLKGIFGIDGQQYEAQKIQVSLAGRHLLSFV